MHQYKVEENKRRWVFTLYGLKWFSFLKTNKYRISAYQKTINIGSNPVIEHNICNGYTHGLGGSLKSISS